MKTGPSFHSYYRGVQVQSFWRGREKTSTILHTIHLCVAFKAVSVLWTREGGAVAPPTCYFRRFFETLRPSSIKNTLHWLFGCRPEKIPAIVQRDSTGVNSRSIFPFHAFFSKGLGNTRNLLVLLWIPQPPLSVTVTSNSFEHKQLKTRQNAEISRGDDFDRTTSGNCIKGAFGG